MSRDNQHVNLETMVSESGGPGLPSAASGIRLLLVVMVLIVFIGSAAQAIHFELGMMVTQWILILPASLWYWRRYKVQPAVFGRVKSFDAGFLPIILLLALCTWIINMVFAAGLVSFLMGIGFEPIEKIAYPSTVEQLVTYYVVIALSAGICEEALFRGALMPSFERDGYVPALLLSSVLFALMHMSLLSLPGTFFLGITIGLVVIKTGSLLAGVLYHILNNFFAVTYMYIYSNSSMGASAEPFNIEGLLLFAVPAVAGTVFCLLKIQGKSEVPPLLKNREGWFPRGWFTWAMAFIIIIFILIASLEMLIPILFYLESIYGTEFKKMNEAFTIIHNISSLTHAHKRSQIACGIYISISSKLTRRRDIRMAVKSGVNNAMGYYRKHAEFTDELRHFNRLAGENFEEIPEELIKSSGYVVDTLEAAVWCLLKTKSYKECVLKAVNLGGDTDTVAAVAGGLAGLYYGYESIPKEWLHTIAKRDYIESLCFKLNACFTG